MVGGRWLEDRGPLGWFALIIPPRHVIVAIGHLAQRTHLGGSTLSCPPLSCHLLLDKLSSLLNHVLEFIDSRGPVSR